MVNNRKGVDLGFWTAWQFLTILPAPGNKGTGERGIGTSIAYFPVIGLIIGGVLLGLDQLFDLFLPRFLIDALLIVALVILTGALHLDGFMDTCDGFAVKTTAEDRLRVMSDSRVGGFGVAGACCLILLKFASLVSLPEELRAVALLLMPTISRWGAAYCILSFPSARKQGLGQMYKERAGWLVLAIATLLTLAIVSIFLTYIGPVLVVAIWLIIYLVAKGLSYLLAGLTGDTYGFMIEVSEVCILIAIIVIDKAGGTSWLDLS